jgi:hypothetical protein
MNNWCIYWGFTHILTKCTVQAAKSPVKNLVRQRCAEGFNSGVKGLIVIPLKYFILHHIVTYLLKYCYISLLSTFILQILPVMYTDI